MASDRQYIACEVVGTNSRGAPLQRSFWAGNVTKVINGRFVETLGTGTVALEGTPGCGGAAADTVVNYLITTAFGVSITEGGIEIWSIFYELVGGGNCTAPEEVSQTPPLHTKSKQSRGACAIMTEYAGNLFTQGRADGLHVRALFPAHPVREEIVY